MPGLIPIILSTITLVGVAYTLAGVALAGRWRTPMLLPAREYAGLPSITMLKPLHGPEPDLSSKLAGFLDQDYPGVLDMVCGVSRADDPALGSIPPAARIVIDPTRHGSNAKISNLLNMMHAATGDLLILSDSDMIVSRDYAARIVAALDQPGVGAVTLLYAGRGEGNGWSRIAAAGISWGFLPSVMVGLATGLAKPCMGSTIALRRATLEAIGGFTRFADLLADDHAIGTAVRKLGLKVTVPPPIILHGSTETNLAALCRHELRWNATVRILDPVGYIGATVAFPFAWGVIAWAVGAGWGWPLAAFATRLLLALRIDSVSGQHPAPLWWLPARDLLSFGLHIAAIFTRSVDWRGSRLHMRDNGRVAAETEIG